MPRRVDAVDHCRERRRFSGTRRTGNEHKTARLAAKIGYDMRQSKLFKGSDLVRDHAEYARDALFLLENIDAKTREPLKPDRVVELHLLRELIRLFGGDVR